MATLMNESIVLDTSVYIKALRGDGPDILSRANIVVNDKSTPLWLSAVVLEELFAGASDTRAIKALTQFENNFNKLNRILVPNQTDWSIAGQILNKIGKKYGFEKIGKARLTNDTVLAMSVARNGFTLLTANVKDFRLISEYREIKWRVI